MTTPEQIAARLTKAQKALLIEGGPCVAYYKPSSRLIALGLWASGDYEYMVPGIITPLGQQVAAILKDRP